MFGFIGAHFDILVLIGFGLFTVVLGYQSIADNIPRRLGVELVSAVNNGRRNDRVQTHSHFHRWL